MKRVYRLIVGLMMLVPFMVKATDYGIENFYVNAEVKMNGDIEVEEYFYLNGSYNGYERIINFGNGNAYPFDSELDYYGGSVLHNGSDIVLEEIRGIDIDDDFDFSDVSGDVFDEVYSADKGDYGVYTVSRSSYGESYKIFLPSYENKAFYIKYTLKNMAILHNDVGEIGWNVMGDENRESIGNLRVKVTFPNNKNEFRVWAHGPLNGEVEKVSNNILLARIERLMAYKAVDIRAVFDKDVISECSKKSNVNALDKILNYEENKANQANYERENIEKENERVALEKIEGCYRDVSRSCYDNASYYLDRVKNKDVYNDYKKRLDDLKILVNEKEEKDAIDSVRMALDYEEYYWYQEALDKVGILENSVLKNELFEKLDVVREKIISKEKVSDGVNIFFAILLLGGILVIGIVVYKRIDKEYKSDFNHKYLREFPDSLSPTSVSYLFKRSISNDAISAEILSLINRGAILYEKNSDREDDYVLKKNLEYKEGLSIKEDNIMEFVFFRKDVVTLKDMKRDAKRSYRSFKNRWDDVIDTSMYEALNEKLYEDDSFSKNSKNNFKSVLLILLYVTVIPFVMVFIASVLMKFVYGPLVIVFMPIVYVFVLPIIISFSSTSKSDKSMLAKKRKIPFVIISVLVMVLSLGGIFVNSIMNHFVHVSRSYHLIVIICSIVLIIYIIKAGRRTEKGALSYNKWKAFKNFLNDFGTMDTKELPEVRLWNDYLVYALVLGCADKLEKVMKIKLAETGTLNSDIFDVRDMYYMSRVINSTITSSMRSANAAERTANSRSSSSGGGSWSSGSGGGGGFSSGGGSFGGGGGGGRF